LAADFDLVLRSRRELHQAAAALSIALVVPERKTILPGALVFFPVAHRAAGGTRIGGRLPVQADRFKGGDEEECVEHVRENTTFITEMPPPRVVRRADVVDPLQSCHWARTIGTW